MQITSGLHSSRYSHLLATNLCLQSKLEADGSADLKVGEITFKLAPSMVSIVKEPTKVPCLLLTGVATCCSFSLLPPTSPLPWNAA